MFSYIKFTNIGPFRNFETKCGQAMLVTADNGEGKSTFLAAIRALLDDHNADLITIGEEEAEAYFEFTNGMTVRQTITKRGSKYDIRLPDGQKVLKRHKEFLQSLVTGIALDPMKLISCSKDERVDYLLSVLPITFQPEAIHEACGIAPPDTLTLEQFDNLLAAKESDRSEQNKRVDASKGFFPGWSGHCPNTNRTARIGLRKHRSFRVSATSSLPTSRRSSRSGGQTSKRRGQSRSHGSQKAIEAARLEFERKKQEILRRSSEEQGRLEREAGAAIEFEQLRVAPELEIRERATSHGSGTRQESVRSRSASS
jgi:energy-coupling factor transporter ATP-binding protein EcfA2